MTLTKQILNAYNHQDKSQVILVKKIPSDIYSACVADLKYDFNSECNSNMYDFFELVNEKERNIRKFLRRGSPSYDYNILLHNIDIFGGSVDSLKALRTLDIVKSVWQETNKDKNYRMNQLLIARPDANLNHEILDGWCRVHNALGWKEHYM